MPAFALRNSVWLEWMNFSGCEVRVGTTQGKDRTGLLGALDPETGSIILLVQPGPTLHVVLGHALKGIARVKESDAHQEIEMSDLLDAALASRTCALQGLDSSPTFVDDIVRVLRDMRIPVKVVDTDGSEYLSVMDDRARIVPPYRARDCRSSNETILLRLRSILSSQELEEPKS
jgi:Gemin6 protein